jgi:hypothetical protein
LLVLRICGIAFHLPGEVWPRGDRDRAVLVRQLDSLPGPQLVFVHYRPTHSPHQEWVYNGADLENSKVVWARQMDAASDQDLIHYFKNRQVWIVDPDQNPPQLVAYDGRVSPFMPVAQRQSATQP